MVLTPHNNKLYKIQGVDGSINICSKFIDENGSSISYKDYYEQVIYFIIIIFFFIGPEILKLYAS